MLRLIGRTAQEMDAGRGALLHVFNSDQHLVGVVGREQRREDSNEDQYGKDHHTDNSQALVKEIAQCVLPQATRLGRAQRQLGFGGNLFGGIGSGLHGQNLG